MTDVDDPSEHDDVHHDDEAEPEAPPQLRTRRRTTSLWRRQGSQRRRWLASRCMADIELITGCRCRSTRLAAPTRPLLRECRASVFIRKNLEAQFRCRGVSQKPSPANVAGHPILAAFCRRPSHSAAACRGRVPRLHAATRRRRMPPPHTTATCPLHAAAAVGFPEIGPGRAASETSRGETRLFF